jgi:hypothetical protein
MACPERIGSAKAAAPQDRLIVALTRSFGDVGSMSGLQETDMAGRFYAPKDGILKHTPKLGSHSQAGTWV